MVQSKRILKNLEDSTTHMRQGSQRSKQTRVIANSWGRSSSVFSEHYKRFLIIFGFVVCCYMLEVFHPKLWRQKLRQAIQPSASSQTTPRVAAPSQENQSGAGAESQHLNCSIPLTLNYRKDSCSTLQPSLSTVTGWYEETLNFNSSSSFAPVLNGCWSLSQSALSCLKDTAGPADIRQLSTSLLLEHLNRTRRDGVTAVLLHWRRTRGIGTIAAYLSKYSFINSVIIWNNNINVTLSLEMIKQGNNFEDALVEKLCIVNSDHNFGTKARYMAAATLTFASGIYFQDDDWDSEVFIPALYTAFQKAPDSIHAITNLPTYRDNRANTFVDHSLGLHTGFAWIGCGSFLRRQKAANFLAMVDSFFPDSPVFQLHIDAMFTLLSNQIPHIYSVDLVPLGGPEAAKVSIYNLPNAANEIQHVQGKALTALVEILQADTGDKNKDLPKEQFVMKQAGAYGWPQSSSAIASDGTALFETNFDAEPNPLLRHFDVSTQRNQNSESNSKFREQLWGDGEDSYFHHSVSCSVSAFRSPCCWRLPESQLKSENRPRSKSPLFFFGYDLLTLGRLHNFRIYYNSSNRDWMSFRLELVISSNGEDWVVVPPMRRGNGSGANKTNDDTESRVRFIVRESPSTGSVLFTFLLMKEEQSNAAFVGADENLTYLQNVRFFRFRVSTDTDIAALASLSLCGAGATFWPDP